MPPYDLNEDRASLSVEWNNPIRQGLAAQRPIVVQKFGGTSVGSVPRIHHVATLAMALDPGVFVIGGGLMDPEATTQVFRERYLRTIRETALPHLWPAQRARLTITPAALGELSQSIGAALVALYHSRS